MRPNIPYNAVLIRYGEIALKKANRKRFEFDLIANIKHVLRELPELKIKRVHGRMTMWYPDHRDFTPEEVEIIANALPRVFGLASFSLGIQTDSELEKIEEAIVLNFPAIVEQYPEGEIPYRMRARRSNKRFALRSKEVEIHFAEKLIAEHPRLKVDLINAELTVALEIRDEWTFISFDQVECMGGLPTGSSDPVLTLLSGGIDSPVACNMINGRGCRSNFLTFHSYPYTTPELLEKVAKLAEVMNRYQLPGRLFACNMSEAQKVFRDACAPRFRTILYRRLMFRVAEKLAKRLGDQALVTGESLGQVASQTVPNMDTINDSTDMLVLRPLLAIDKNMTVARARQIGTFELSNIQCEDSCTVFQPDSPATNSRRHLLEFEEEKVNMNELLEVSLQNIIELSIPDAEEKPFPLSLQEESDK